MEKLEQNWCFRYSEFLYKQSYNLTYNASVIQARLMAIRKAELLFLIKNRKRYPATFIKKCYYILPDSIKRFFSDSTAKTEQGRATGSFISPARHCPH